MTAEITILNRNAVAMAADSAVTLQSGPQVVKIYNTNKLFTISKYQPVGIMIFGNAEFMDFPWEVAIKDYRAQLGKTAFAEIDGYGRDFLKFVRRNRAFLASGREPSHFYMLIASWIRRLKERLYEVAFDEIQRNGPITEKRLQQLFVEVVKDEAKHLKKYPVLAQMRNLHAAAISRRFKGPIQQAIAVEAKDLLSGSVAADLEAMAGEMVRRDVYWDNCTGVVIAGFGERQLFPSMRCYEFSSVINKNVRFRELKSRRVDIDLTKETAAIHAFAQSEMVGQFMEGIDSEFTAFILEFLRVTLESGYPDLAKRELGSSISPRRMKQFQSALSSYGARLLGLLHGKMNQYSRTKHSDPIVEIVNILPKEEIAAMAEALVNLTSFKRHITKDAETVGGPIDVAVISKGDGFIWIKRKHYFSKELNPHFFSNYYLNA